MKPFQSNVLIIFQTGSQWVEEGVLLLRQFYPKYVYNWYTYSSRRIFSVKK